MKNELTLQKLANKIKKTRINKNLRQKDVADTASMHWNYLSDLEAGRKNITIKTLERIANALDIRIIDLFTDISD